MTPEEKELMAEAIAQALRRNREERTTRDDWHNDHHQWVSVQIEKDKWRAEFWSKMVSHVANWGIISVITAVGFAIWLAFEHWLRKGGS